MNDKIVVTNFSAMKRKYAGADFNTIYKALNKYVQADLGRGCSAVIVAIDDEKIMKTYGAKAVTDPLNEKQNKQAIDGVFVKTRPDYLVLLGALDIIPHQSVRNPVFSADDPDEFAFSDLPYACDAPYSQDPGDFTAATRVVGRIPDITGKNDVQYLLDLLDALSSWKQADPASYLKCLGITAWTWRNSTGLSLQNIFGDPTLQTSPSAGPNWSVSDISCLSHFINCHGAEVDSFYYGEKNGKYPKAHSAAYLGGSPLTEGTIVAAECCFGAELYDPQLANGVMGICNTYLKQKAYAFFGSSTIAYGPADSNSDADLICQYFLKSILSGASTGRAALEARQEFVRTSGLLDPVNLKTLAQLNLMSDPSIHPVAVPKSETALGMKSKFTATDWERSQRRLNLKVLGEALSQSVPISKMKPSVKRESGVKPALKHLLRKERFLSPTVLTFNMVSVSPSLIFKDSSIMGLSKTFTSMKRVLPDQVHVIFNSTEKGSTAKTKALKASVKSLIPKIRRASAIVAWEKDGKIISYRKVHQH
jgi:hypothetical protein